MNDYPRKRYGQHIMHGFGRKYDPTRCAYEVGNGWRYHQCKRPSGHGDRGLFCKQHARKFPASVKETDGGAL